MERVLVTGGTGFVGAYVARRLVQAGHGVIALDPRPSNVINTVLTSDELAEVQVREGDATSLRDVAYAIREDGATRIVHLASLLHPASDEDPPLAVHVNIQGQTTILEAARLFDVQKVVWASSVVVFGARTHHAQIPVPNDAPHHPGNLYAATKSFNERLTERYVAGWGVDALGLRFTVVYGPGRVRGASAFVGELSKPALGEPALVPYGDDVVDWQYVEDVAELLVKCAFVPKTETSVFNTRFDTRSVKDAGDEVRRLIPSAQIDYQPGEFGVAWELDDSRLQREVGFQPAYQMERGLRAVLDHTRTAAGLPPLEPPRRSPR